MERSDRISEKATVRIRVQGEQTERFLNLCKAREIKISSES